MKKVIKDISLKLMFHFLEELHEFHNDLPFLYQRIKSEKVGKLVANLHDIKLTYYTQKFKMNIKLWVSFEKNSESDLF